MKFYENPETDLFLENGQTDRHDEASNRFSKLFFESLIAKGVTGNMGRFLAVSDAKPAPYQSNLRNFLQI
jgi:hypothetical protein